MVNGQCMLLTICVTFVTVPQTLSLLPSKMEPSNEKGFFIWSWQKLGAEDLRKTEVKEKSMIVLSSEDQDEARQHGALLAWTRLLDQHWPEKTEAELLRTWMNVVRWGWLVMGWGLQGWLRGKWSDNGRTDDRLGERGEVDRWETVERMNTRQAQQGWRRRKGQDFWSERKDLRAWNGNVVSSLCLCLCCLPGSET